MYILIEDDALLKIYIYIDNGNKVSSSIKQEFNMEPIQNKTLLTTKRKIL